MASQFARLRKISSEIDKNRSDYLKDPARYLEPALELLRKTNLKLASDAERLLESEDADSKSLENFISEMNIFLASSQASSGSALLLQTSLHVIKGIGEKKAESLSKFGLNTVEDALLHFPFRYEAVGYEEGERRVMSGTLETRQKTFTRGRKAVYRAIFRNENGFFSALWFNFNARYPANALVEGRKYHLYGNVSRYDGAPSVVHPEFIDESEIGRVRPVYSLPANVGQKPFNSAMNMMIEQYLPHMPDTLPVRLADKYDFPEIRSAVKTLHMPDDRHIIPKLMMRTHPAYERFVYEELFYIQLGLLMKKDTYASVPGICFDIKREYLDEVAEIMPFKLTNAQKKVLADIFNDMKSTKQMNRLIQGDVGSGKTIVSFISGIMAVKNGHQVAVIAPTEVLAEQHYINLQKFLEGTGFTAALLTGSVGSRDKRETRELIASGSVDFVVGTHAVIQEDILFHKLGLAIIDEQHRFGVLQRKTLVDKGYNPDIVLMTATPIPRTLSLTFYGDLDVSIIDSLPPGRKPIVTKAYPEKKQSEALKLVQKELDAGRKAYFIYPLIETSEKMELKAAVASYEQIASVFGEERVGLLHGRMKGEEKRELMHRFKHGSIDILVSTTVIEVGVDVPDATVMVIENAERFGLSQLHQLRGRVGRGAEQSYCCLIYSGDISEEGKIRIDAMVKHTDGFKLSEIDLEIRGPGDFFGTRQSGLPRFRFSNIVKDVKILQKARRDAEDILASDPSLDAPASKVLVQTLKTRWNGIDFLNVG
ncbi:ATP-dependent DNA helicase RecG [Limisalsivibrio acetivorans]|uniref:ATP-dependent DNA helicase RecG n=1 Tax=Limisalsivibrio acetivorans TaxID=1304888 RepID=UPI0003B5055C|nr:ATP-dependent DNA helicase RecG [Limisalsivibrio acetivorans]